MADEATLNLSLRFKKDAKDVSFSANGIQMDVSGDDYVKQVQLVGTTEEALAIGDTTPGLILIRNLDGTNFVSIRPATGGTNTIKLLAGEAALFRFATAAPFIIADTASVRVEFLLLDS